MTCDVYLGAPVATPVDPRHRLVTTKYNPARTWTPENAVGIGGAYLCVYGMEGPGGYQFVGRTCQMWNTHRATAEFQKDKPWLLRFFDQIRFYPVSGGELLEFRRDFLHGRVHLDISEDVFRLHEHRRFLRENAADIALHKARQQQAFEAERRRWEATGQIGYAADLPAAHDEELPEELQEGHLAVVSPRVGQRLEDRFRRRPERQGGRYPGSGRIHENGIAGDRAGGRRSDAIALHRGTGGAGGSDPAHLQAECRARGGLTHELKIRRRRMTIRTKGLQTAAAWLLLAAVLAAPQIGRAAERTSFNVAWSIYVGWMPWDYADRSGILKKWAAKYGITIKLTQVNDYVESINQYTAGTFDACVMTNMDMLTIPAAGGVDSTALIVGDFSNGNDGVVLKGKGRKLEDIKGQKVNLVELSVSHYLLVRGLSSIGLRERDLKIVNTSDADIVAAFASPASTAVVTWKPQLSEVLTAPTAQLVFDSSKIPGEIIDLMVVNTATLRANPKLGKALVGAWYETLALMFRNDAAGKAAQAAMAKASGTNPDGFSGQLATTHMFTTPALAFEFATGEGIVKTMDLVRRFSFEHGILGQGAGSVDAVGIQFPGGRSLGDAKNPKMRFDTTYTKLAVDGSL